jgi:hypothetical protein
MRQDFDINHAPIRSRKNLIMRVAGHNAIDGTARALLDLSKVTNFNALRLRRLIT